MVNGKQECLGMSTGRWQREEHRQAGNKHLTYYKAWKRGELGTGRQAGRQVNGQPQSNGECEAGR